MDTAIVNTTLLTFRDDRLGIVEEGSIAIDGGEIASVGPISEFDPTDAHTASMAANALFGAYDDEPLMTPMYGPQALDMVSPELLEEIRPAALDRGSKIHMHVAQGDRERLQIEERYGADVTTVSVLADHDMLAEFLIAAHCHGTTADERAQMVEAGVNMIGCPSSISMIDGIVPPLHHYTSLDGMAEIGTDQAPDTGHHNMVREIRTASFHSKTDQSDPTALPAWKALRLATIEGARALGLGDRIGSLGIGKRADLITVDVRTPDLVPTVSAPLRTIVPNLVYSATGEEIRDVFVDIDHGRSSTRPTIVPSACFARARTTGVKLAPSWSTARTRAGSEGRDRNRPGVPLSRTVTVVPRQRNGRIAAP